MKAVHILELEPDSSFFPDLSCFFLYWENSLPRFNFFCPFERTIVKNTKSYFFILLFTYFALLKRKNFWQSPFVIVWHLKFYPHIFLLFLSKETINEILLSLRDCNFSWSSNSQLFLSRKSYGCYVNNDDLKFFFLSDSTPKTTIQGHMLKKQYVEVKPNQKI